MRREFLSLVNHVLDGAQQGISSMKELANLRQKNNFLLLELSRERAQKQVLEAKFVGVVKDCNYVLAAVEASKPDVPKKELGDAAKRLREMIADLPATADQKAAARLAALHRFGLVPESK